MRRRSPAYRFDVGVAADPGDRYLQPTVPGRTPAYVVQGARMEDAHVIVEHRGGLVVAVADGHGSTKQDKGLVVGGREAADVACHVVRERAASCKCHAPAVFRFCQDALRAAPIPGYVAARGGLMVRKADGTLEAAVHGTTLCVATVEPDGAAHVAYVGDTMCALFPSDGAPPFFVGAPHDITNQPETQRVLAAGAKKWRNKRHFVATAGPDQAEYLVELTRAIGHFSNAWMSQVPTEFALPAGWRALVVATDGVWDHVAPETAARLVDAAGTAQECAEALVANAGAASAGQRRDNATAVVVFASPVDPGPEEAACRCALM